MPASDRITQLSGVGFNYITALDLTLKQILSASGSAPTSDKVRMKIKDGADAYGSHGIY